MSIDPSVLRRQRAAVEVRSAKVVDLARVRAERAQRAKTREEGRRGGLQSAALRHVKEIV
jgi:hypothetical protein